MLIALTPGFSVGDGAEEMICDGCGQLVGASGGARYVDSETQKGYLIARDGPHSSCFKAVEEQLNES